MNRFSFLILTGLIAAVPFAAAKEVPKPAAEQVKEYNRQVQAAADKGDLQSAVTAAEKAYELARKEFGAESLETAKAMNNMANLYMFAGFPAHAERLYKDALLIEVMKDPGGTGIADSYFNLGMSYAMQKKYAAADEVLSKTFTLRTEKLGKGHPDTLKAKAALDQVRAEIPSEKIS